MVEISQKAAAQQTKTVTGSIDLNAVAYPCVL